MIVKTYEIPLSAENQTFHIPLGNTNYVFTLRWNYRASLWILNIADTNENPLLNGVPLVIGVNLLAGHKAYAIGGIGTNMFIISVAKPGHFVAENPGFDDLGVNTRLYYSMNLPDEEV